MFLKLYFGTLETPQSLCDSSPARRAIFHIKPPFRGGDAKRRRGLKMERNFREQCFLYNPFANDIF